MIPRAFKVLLPCPPTATVEQQQAGQDSPSSCPANVSEHARLSANTAELWRQLATRLGGMP